MTIVQSCFNYLVNEYRSAPNKVEFLKTITWDGGTGDDDRAELIENSLRRIIKHGFTEEYKINMFQKKGHIQLQNLLMVEIDRQLMDVEHHFQNWICEQHKAKTLFEILNPKPVGTPTEIEAIQCYICATNKKDRALACGHSYCCCCLEVLPNAKCPECNTVFDKTKVIKLYL